MTTVGCCPLSTGRRRSAFHNLVIPAKAGIQSVRRLTPHWIPAFAGMTKSEGRQLPAPKPPSQKTAVLHYPAVPTFRSEEHTSELQSLMRISYDVFCLKKKKLSNQRHTQ